jgi:hypothetical protein
LGSNSNKIRIKALIREQVIEKGRTISELLEDMRNLADSINAEADTITDIVKQKRFRYKAVSIQGFIDQVKSAKRVLFINLEIKE